MSRVADWRSLWPMCADTVMWQRAGGAAARAPRPGPGPRRAARVTSYETSNWLTQLGRVTEPRLSQARERPPVFENSPFYIYY